MTVSSCYALSNHWDDARARLSSLEQWLDPATRDCLAARGVGPGWSCLEAGGGGGSVAMWLTEQVGDSGAVLATDMDTRFLEPLAGPNLEVRRHDLATESLPRERFDLAHCRLVLAHLPERGRALGEMVAAVRPGGWVVVEEMDFVSVAADPAHEHAGAFMRTMAAHDEVLQGHGMDLHYGRSLFSELRSCGLGEVTAQGHSRICSGATTAARTWQLTFDQLGAEMLEAGLARADFDVARRMCDEPEFSFLSQTVVAACGRRP
ncbi:class I SAM-dependent methyltransferase [Sciscionella marina]|uniref:class I SAM-dependent methyltransferase n=1 Tax=Sciscionella marina TaxID=508770 RepID=UPI0004762BB8|nr:methyltransferase domain-containing protein [Sciscionella marina]